MSHIWKQAVCLFCVLSECPICITHAYIVVHLFYFWVRWWTGYLNRENSQHQIKKPCLVAKVLVTVYFRNYILSVPVFITIRKAYNLQLILAAEITFSLSLQLNLSPFSAFLSPSFLFFPSFCHFVLSSFKQVFL